MKKIWIIVLLVLSISNVKSQGCLPEGITFSAQAQIDYFSVVYPGCTEIEGNLTLGETGNNLENLEGLSVLTKVHGNLTITRLQNVTSLSGLHNIDSIGGDLIISLNADLVNLIDRKSVV